MVEEVRHIALKIMDRLDAFRVSDGMRTVVILHIIRDVDVLVLAEVIELSRRDRDILLLVDLRPAIRYAETAIVEHIRLDDVFRLEEVRGKELCIVVAADDVRADRYLHPCIVDALVCVSEQFAGEVVRAASFDRYAHRFQLVARVCVAGRIAFPEQLRDFFEDLRILHILIELPNLLRVEVAQMFLLVQCLPAETVDILHRRALAGHLTDRLSKHVPSADIVELLALRLTELDILELFRAEAELHKSTTHPTRTASRFRIAFIGGILRAVIWYRIGKLLALRRQDFTICAARAENTAALAIAQIFGDVRECVAHRLRLRLAEAVLRLRKCIVECCHRVAQPSEETLNERLVFPAHLAEQVNTFVHVRHCVGKHLFDRIGVREFRPADCIAVRLQLFRRELLPAADVIHHLAVQFRVVAAEPMQVLMPEYPRRRLRGAAVNECDALVVEAAQIRRAVEEYDLDAHLLAKLLHGLLSHRERRGFRELDVLYHVGHTALCRRLAVAEKCLSFLQEGIALVLILEQETVLSILTVVAAVCLCKFLDRSVVVAEVRFWAGTELDFVRLGMLILISREVWRFARNTFYPRFVQLYGRGRRRFHLASIASIVAFRHDHVLHAVKQCVDIVDVAKINVIICPDIIKRSLMFLLARVAVEDDDMRTGLCASS